MREKAWTAMCFVREWLWLKFNLGGLGRKELLALLEKKGEVCFKSNREKVWQAYLATISRIHELMDLVADSKEEYSYELREKAGRKVISILLSAEVVSYFPKKSNPFDPVHGRLSYLVALVGALPTLHKEVLAAIQYLTPSEKEAFACFSSF